MPGHQRTQLKLNRIPIFPSAPLGLAQKTYDDVPLSPRSFVELWRCISSRQTEFRPANQEIVFLGLIDWNTHVKNHMY